MTNLSKHGGTHGVAEGDFQIQNTELFERRALAGKTLARLQAKAERGELTDEGDSELRRTARDFDGLTYEIVAANYGLVRNYVQRFTSRSTTDADDFEAAGRLGLLRAIHSYDPSKGSFGQWAFKPIQREVLRAVRDADHPNLNPGDFDKRPTVLNAAAEFARKYGDDVPLDYKEVAEIAGVTAAQVRRIIDAPRFESISSMVGAADGETPLADLLVDGTPGVEEQVLRTAEIRSIVEHGLPALDARELFVLARRFSLDGEPEQSLSAIGAMLGLSGEGVRQIQARAMAKLNHPAVLGRLVHDRPGAPAPAPRTAGDADSGNGLPSDDMLRRLRTRVRGG